MANEPTVRVTDQPQESRFEVYSADELAGVADYRDEGNVRTFIRTLVHASFEGQGLANQLARYALDDARARGLMVIPRCPFFAQFIKRHADYADLVYQAG